MGEGGADWQEHVKEDRHGSDRGVDCGGVRFAGTHMEGVMEVEVYLAWINIAIAFMLLLAVLLKANDDVGTIIVIIMFISGIVLVANTMFKQ